MKVAIYTRVSTDDQSCAAQESELLTWAVKCGHEVVAVYEDHGISGAKGRAERPKLDAILKGAVRRDFDILAVWDLDRLGRDASDLLLAYKVLDKCGVELHIHQAGFDTSTDAGHMLYGLKSLFAEQERRQIVARVKRGVAHAQKHGTKSGKPFGRPKVEKEIKATLVAAFQDGCSVREAARRAGASYGVSQRTRAAAVETGLL